MISSPSPAASSPVPGKVLQLVQVAPAQSAGRRFSLRAGVNYAGRVADNDVAIDRPLISRRHAKLIYTELGLTVHDLDSQNGIFVNGEKIRSAAVQPGDHIYLADTCFRVEATDAQEAADAFAVDSSVTRVDRLSAVLRGDRSRDEEVRNLSALLDATDHAGSDGPGSVIANLLGVCHELTEAELAAVVTRTKDGELRIDEVIGASLEAAGGMVSWPVVRRAVDEAEVLFSRDAAREPLVPGDVVGAEQSGACMVVPIVVDGEGRGVLYLSRETPGACFGRREVETVSTVAHLLARRLAGPGREDTVVNAPMPLTDSAAGGGGGTSEEAQAELLRRVEELEGALAERERALSNKDARITELEEQRAEDASRSSDVAAAEQDTRDAVERERHELATQLEEARQELEHARGFEASSTELGRRVEALSAELESAVAQRASLYEEAESLEVARTELAHKIDDLERELEAATTQASASTYRVGELEQELAQAGARASELAHENEQLRSEVDASSDRVIALQRDLDGALARVAELEARVGELSSAGEEARAQAEGQTAELAEIRETHVARAVVRSALERSLPPRQAGRLASLALGETPRADLGVGRAAALVLSLSGGDAWAASAEPEAARHVLDEFCLVTAEEAGAHDGFVEQVFGHRHLITFAGNVDGVRSAVACARGVIGRLRAAGIECQAGIHLANVLSGFFGRDERAVFLELGEASAVARGACAYAEPGRVWVSEVVREMMIDGADVFVALGPYLMREFGKKAVSLYQLEEPRET